MKVYRLLDEEHPAPRRMSLASTPNDLASNIAELMAEVFLRRKEETRC
jgi:hypothetical protein